MLPVGKHSDCDLKDLCAATMSHDDPPCELINELHSRLLAPTLTELVSQVLSLRLCSYLVMLYVGGTASGGVDTRACSAGRMDACLSLNFGCF